MFPVDDNREYETWYKREVMGISEEDENDMMEGLTPQE
jgi:hypothetical protein